MFPVKDYYQTAIKYEAVFRNILRDLKNNREERPGGDYVPEDLETEAPLEEIFKKYSEGSRYGLFTIYDFTRPTNKSAIIAFEDVITMPSNDAESEDLVNESHSVHFHTLSGRGAELEYLVKEDDSVIFQKQIHPPI